jgi:hypothetical protein
MLPLLEISQTAAAPPMLQGVLFGRNIKGIAAMLQGQKIPAAQVGW